MDITEDVDRALIARMRREDPAGLSGLYDRHAGRVLGLARRILGNSNDAEDIVQEAFLQVWSQRHKYDATRGAVLTWILMIARSRALDRVRAGRTRLDALTLFAEASSDCDTAPTDVWLATRARGAMASLPAGQRLAIELAFFAGCTHSEIAALLRQPLGTVKTRLRLAMLKLRDWLARPETPNCASETPFTVSLVEHLTDLLPTRKVDPLEGVRVLVVDDDPDTLDMVATVLECAGASVIRGRSTTEALLRLKTDWPDVLLADLAMPGEDGFALVRRVRSLDRAERRLPAAAFTAFTDERNRRAALAAGYDVYLTKPIQPNAIVQAVAGLAANRH